MPFSFTRPDMPCHRCLHTVVILLGLMLAGTSLAEQRKTFVIGAHDWPPYASPDSKYMGLAPRIVTEVLQGQGIDGSYRFVPWSEALDGILTENLDGALVWLPEDIKTDNFLVSDPLLPDRAVLCQRKNMPAVTGMDELMGYRMGMNPHYVYDESSYRMLKDKFMIPIKQETDMGNFRLLLDNKIDFFLTPQLTSTPLLRNQFSPDEQNALTCTGNLFTFPPLRLVVNKHRNGSAELIRQFNLRLGRLSSSGILDRYAADFRYDRY